MHDQLKSHIAAVVEGIKHLSVDDAADLLVDLRPVPAAENARAAPMTTQCKLPIKAACDIAKAHGWDQVIVVARKVGDDGYEHVVTYGEGPAHCEAAARAGVAIKHHLMRWPAALFDSALRVLGVGRDKDHPKFLSVALSVEPSDDALRMVHEMLRPPTLSPADIERDAQSF